MVLLLWGGRENSQQSDPCKIVLGYRKARKPIRLGIGMLKNRLETAIELTYRPRNLSISTVAHARVKCYAQPVPEGIEAKNNQQQGQSRE